MQELAPAFEKASGHKLKIQYDGAGKIADMVAADQDIDVAILTKPLADKLVGKAKLVGDLIKNGQAEIGMQPISELMEVKGIDIVGPLPTELQSPDLVFVAASRMASEKPLPAKALIDFLAAPAAKAVYKAKGMEPD